MRNTECGGSRLRALFQAPYAKWAAIFLAATVLIHPRYGTNPRSRFAALCGMVEDSSLCIDRYKELTIDWARTPEDHYYSNKAPGPVLIAFPLYWAIDKLWTLGAPDRAARDHVRISHISLWLALLSLLFQAVPFAVLGAIGMAWLQEHGASRAAVQFSCLAILFGNTAALFMNTYFGHGMTAVCVLGLALCLVKRLHVLAGLASGFALLSDYPCALLLPGLVVAALFGEPKRDWWRVLARIAVGGILPGALWVTYHISCFGSPFALPYRYQNPRFVHTEGNLILGLFNLAPQPAVAAELLLGFKRGILCSQPWLLIVLVCCFWSPAVSGRLPQAARRACARLIVLLVPGLLLLLGMNASFTEWQGGSTPGPRYLCSVFPAFGLLGGLCYDRMPPIVRRLLNGGLGVSVLLWILVSSTGILVPAWQTPWGFTLRSLTSGESLGPVITFTLLVIVFEWQVYGLVRRRQGGLFLPPQVKASGSLSTEV